MFWRETWKTRNALQGGFKNTLMGSVNKPCEQSLNKVKFILATMIMNLFTKNLHFMTWLHTSWKDLRTRLTSGNNKLLFTISCHMQINRMNRGYLFRLRWTFAGFLILYHLSTKMLESLGWREEFHPFSDYKILYLKDTLPLVALL